MEKVQQAEHKMPLKTITDRKGRQYTWNEYDGHGFFDDVSHFLVPEGWEAKMKSIKSLEIRDDDICICTYPKAGTHWIWEIVSMVMKGTAEYETRTKEALMLEFQSADTIGSVPSPRILNTHFAASCLPDQICNRKTKIINVMRNPKDILASYYHHMKIPFEAFGDDEKPFVTFSDFLPYVTGEYGVYMFVSIWRYIKEMEKFTKDNPEQALILHFEDMKVNPTEAVRKVARFLNKDLSEETVNSIAEKCSFRNLKAANDSLKKRPEQLAERVRLLQEKGGKIPSGPPNLYRKGEVGDWKNHFTVAENEQFDKLLQEELKDCNIKFIYSL